MMIENSEWGKSTFSNPDGNCVETQWRKSAACKQDCCIEAASWRKTTFSHNGGSCVETGHGDGEVGVRDTKQAHLGDARDVLTFSAAQWTAFVGGLK